MSDKPQAEALDIKVFENEQPDVPVSLVPVKGGEILKLGTITIRIMEDGSNTGISPIPPPSPLPRHNH